MQTSFCATILGILLASSASANTIGTYPLFEYELSAGSLGNGDSVLGSMVMDIESHVVLSVDLTIYTDPSFPSPYGGLIFNQIYSQGLVFNDFMYSVRMLDTTGFVRLDIAFYQGQPADWLASGIDGPSDTPNGLINPQTGERITTVSGAVIRIVEGAPEPSTWLLCAGGLGAAIMRRRRLTAAAAPVSPRD